MVTLKISRYRATRTARQLELCIYELGLTAVVENDEVDNDRARHARRGAAYDDRHSVEGSVRTRRQPRLDQRDGEGQHTGRRHHDHAVAPRERPAEHHDGIADG